jgi:hypothetical protein
MRPLDHIGHGKISVGLSGSDKEHRRATQLERFRRVSLALNGLSRFAIQASVESRLFEADHLCETCKPTEIEMLLITEEAVVHRPESVLTTGTLSGFRRLCGRRVVREWPIENRNSDLSSGHVFRFQRRQNLPGKVA